MTAHAPLSTGIVVIRSLLHLIVSVIRPRAHGPLSGDTAIHARLLVLSVSTAVRARARLSTTVAACLPLVAVTSATRAHDRALLCPDTDTVATPPCPIIIAALRAPVLAPMLSVALAITVLVLDRAADLGPPVVGHPTRIRARTLPA